MEKRENYRMISMIDKMGGLKISELGIAWDKLKFVLLRLRHLADAAGLFGIVALCQGQVMSK